MSCEKFSRRTALALGLAGIGAVSLAQVPGSLQERTTTRRKVAKNIIFCCSDGMSTGAMTMVDHFSQINEGSRSYWAWLMNQSYAVNGLMDTASLSSSVTDSAAASSSWGSGCRIINGQLNTYPDGTELKPIWQILKEHGMRVGVATTATVTHATPAGFCINSMRRDDEAGIAEKYLQAGIDVILGGGERFFSADTREDKKDLYNQYSRASYVVARERDELLKNVGASKMLGIFSPSHMPYTVDHTYSAELRRDVPTLAEMSRVAIESLRKSPNGFALQIEGARVDHAAHPNDLAGLFYDQVAFEEAVKVAIDFALRDGETLVIVTSDHGNANPGLNGVGREYGLSNGMFETVKGMRSSYQAMGNELQAANTVPELQSLFKVKLGLEVSSEHCQQLLDARKNNPLRGLTLYGYPTAHLAMVLGSYTGVGWTSGAHTSDHTIVTAIGPGAELFRGLVKNTDVFHHMLAARDLRFTGNRQITLEEAERMRKDGDTSASVEQHWL